MAAKFSIIAALASAILLTPAYAGTEAPMQGGIYSGDGPSVDWSEDDSGDSDHGASADDGSRPGYDTIDPACIGSGNMDCNPDAGFYQCGTADFGDGPEPVYCNHNDD